MKARAFALCADSSVALILPIAGDWNADGMDEVGIVRDGIWFIDLNGNDQWDLDDTWFSFGLPTDTAAAGHW